MKYVLMAGVFALAGCGDTGSSSPDLAIKSISDPAPVVTPDTLPAATPSAAPSVSPSSTPTGCPIDMYELADGTCIDKQFDGGFGRGAAGTGRAYNQAVADCNFESRSLCTQDQMQTACGEGKLNTGAFGYWSNIPGSGIRTVHGTSQVIEPTHCALTPTDIGVSSTPPFTIPNNPWYCCQ